MNAWADAVRGDPPARAGDRQRRRRDGAGAGAAAEIGWNDGMSIADSRLLVNYYRTTDDGRIAFGKGGGRLAFGPWLGPRFEGEAPYARAAEEGLRRTYPTLADVPVTHRWTGPDRPHAERAADLRRAVAAPGRGVRRRLLGQRRRVRRTSPGASSRRWRSGCDDEWATCGLVGVAPKRWPPEPFRFAGGSVMKWALERVERAHDEGRGPAPSRRRSSTWHPRGSCRCACATEARIARPEAGPGPLRPRGRVRPRARLGAMEPTIRSYEEDDEGAVVRLSLRGLGSGARNRCET